MLRDVSKAYSDQDMEQMLPATQIVRQKNYCKNPEEIKLGFKVDDFNILPGNQAAV